MHSQHNCTSINLAEIEIGPGNSESESLSEGQEHA
jgi:hypothetical protein